MAEKWRDIAGYDGAYQVSDLGQVRNNQQNPPAHQTKERADLRHSVQRRVSEEVHRPQPCRRCLPRGVPSWPRDHAQRRRLHPQ